MTTTSVQANGTTVPDDWTLAAGASKTAAVNSPDNDATSYIQSGTTDNTYQYFTCAPSLVTGDTITEIVLRARCRRGGATNCTFRIGYSFTPNGGGSQTGESAAGALDATVSWTNFTYTDSGLSVVWGAGLVFWIRNTQGRQLHCTTYYVDITYTPVATGDGQPMIARTRLVPGMGRPHGHQGW